MGGQVGVCERAPQSIGEEERKGLRGVWAKFFGVEEIGFWAFPPARGRWPQPKKANLVGVQSFEHKTYRIACVYSSQLNYAVLL